MAKATVIYYVVSNYINDTDNDIEYTIINKNWLCQEQTAFQYPPPNETTYVRKYLKNGTLASSYWPRYKIRKIHHKNIYDINEAQKVRDAVMAASESEGAKLKKRQTKNKNRTDKERERVPLNKGRTWRRGSPNEIGTDDDDDIAFNRKNTYSVVKGPKTYDVGDSSSSESIVGRKKSSSSQHNRKTSKGAQISESDEGLFLSNLKILSTPNSQHLSEKQASSSTYREEMRDEIHTDKEDSVEKTELDFLKRQLSAMEAKIDKLINLMLEMKMIVDAKTAPINESDVNYLTFPLSTYKELVDFNERLEKGTFRELSRNHLLSIKSPNVKSYVSTIVAYVFSPLLCTIISPAGTCDKMSIGTWKIHSLLVSATMEKFKLYINSSRLYLRPEPKEIGALIGNKIKNITYTTKAKSPEEVEKFRLENEKYKAGSSEISTKSPETTTESPTTANDGEK